MSLRGKIRKLAVIVTVTGAAVMAAPTAAMAYSHTPSVPSESQSLESGSAGVGLFGPHANWFNFHEHSEG